MSVTHQRARRRPGPAEIVSTVFYSASVSDTLAILVAESHRRRPPAHLVQRGAVQLLGYGLDDLRALPCEPAVPDPRRRRAQAPAPPRALRPHDHPVRTASGATPMEAVVLDHAVARRRSGPCASCRPPTSRSAPCAPPPTPTSGASPHSPSARPSRRCSPSRACASRTSTTRSAPWSAGGPSSCSALAGSTRSTRTTSTA